VIVLLAGTLVLRETYSVAGLLIDFAVSPQFTLGVGHSPRASVADARSGLANVALIGLSRVARRTVQLRANRRGMRVFVPANVTVFPGDLRTIGVEAVSDPRATLPVGSARRAGIERSPTHRQIDDDRIVIADVSARLALQVVSAGSLHGRGFVTRPGRTACVIRASAAGE
jgi:hypothetical protein